jgi:hypothetical protein
LLPVVRFAATRLGDPGNTDIWGVATVAELHLHDHFLNERETALELARDLYGQVAALGRPNQRASAARQLRMMGDAGDPPGTIDPLLALFDRL